MTAVRASDPESELSETTADQVSMAVLGDLAAPSLFSSIRCVVVRNLEDLPDELVSQIAAGEDVTPEVTTGERGGRTVTVKATPAVRALARRKDVDLALVAGSGAEGMITAADVERAAATLSAAGPLEPLRGVRRAMASRMTHAHAEVVPATVSDDANVDAWRGRDVTVRLVRASGRGGQRPAGGRRRPCR